MAVLAGADFFTIEVLTWRGLATYYVLFVLHLETRRISLAGITRHPTEAWITQMARNSVDDSSSTVRHVATSCMTETPNSVPRLTTFSRQMVSPA